MLRRESCFTASKLAKSYPTERVERTNTGVIDLTNSPRARAEEDALSGVGCNEVETGNGDAFVTSSCPGDDMDVPITFTQVDCHVSAIRAFVCYDQQ